MVSLAGIAGLLVLAALLLLLVTHCTKSARDPYLAAVNWRAQRERAAIDGRLSISHVQDVAAGRKTPYKIIWHGSDAERRAASPVVTLHEISPDSDPEGLLVLLWVDDGATVRYAAICNRSPDTLKLAKQAVPHAVELLG